MRVDRWLARLEWLARRGWSGLLAVDGWTGLLVAVEVTRALLTLTGWLVLGTDAGFQRMVLTFSWIPSEVSFWPSNRIPSERLRRDLERIGGWTITTKMKRGVEQTSETFRIVLSPFR